MTAPGSLTIIAVTCVISLLAFQRRDLRDRLIFSPERILAGKEYYRLVTSAFLHLDGWHLCWNIVSLYLFGSLLEQWLGEIAFLSIYFGSVIGGSLLSLFIHRHHDYLALGASGSACGVIFAAVLLHPGIRMAFLFVPFPMPGWVFALIYLAVTFWRLKGGRDNIGHDAHLGGAVIGLLIAAAFSPESVREHWEFFTGMLVISAAMLFYIWKNPMFLPLANLWQPGRRSGGGVKSSPSRRPERLRVDEILEKINRKGIESLTAEEKALLEEVWGKYRRREQSSKPDSDLII